MILDEKIKVKTNPANYKYYKKYYNFKCGDEITININELYVFSKTKINVK